MISNNIYNFLVILFMCSIIRKTYSFGNDKRKINDGYPHYSKYLRSNDDQNLIIKKRFNIASPSFSKSNGLESAEMYFDWAGKTQRPVEYLRGKRFWLFAKKDDGGMTADELPSSNKQQNSLTQGLWRSGIVGRRR